MHCVVAAFVLCPLAFAQTDDLARVSKSPTQLAQYVESHKTLDWDKLWNALGRKDPEVFYHPCGTAEEDPCRTQIITILNPDRAILIIHADSYQSNDIYLRYFRKGNDDWQFSGERRAYVTLNYPRRHEIFRFNGKPFLKISSDRTQVGFSLAQEVEEWFDLSQPGLEPVFSFTPQGSYSPFSFGVFLGVHARAWTFAGSDDIDVNLDVHLKGPGFDIPATFTGVYQRMPGAKQFTIREAYSGMLPIPKEDFEGFAGVDFASMPNDRLLVYALPGLKKIASGTDKEGRQWLKLVLEHTKDSQEKRQLLELLAKR